MSIGAEGKGYEFYLAFVAKRAMAGGFPEKRSETTELR